MATAYAAYKEMRDTLTSGRYITNVVVKMLCSKCGNTAGVDVGIAATELVNHGACTCGLCKTKTLIPLRKEG